jgi:exopolysaccharide biosynthesis polyprenyl glycosylphosphotransferase
MLKAHSRVLDVVLHVADVAVSAGVFVALAQGDGMVVATGGGVALLSMLPLGLAASLGWPLALRLFDLYQSKRRETVLRVAAQLAAAGAIVVAFQGAVAFLSSAPVSPRLPVACGLMQLFLLGSLRLALHVFLRSARRSGRNTRNVLIAGSGPRAAYVEQVIARNPAWGLDVVGFIDRAPARGSAGVDPRRVSALDAIQSLLRDHVIDEVIVACPRSQLEVMVAVVDAATTAGVPITLISDLFGDLLPAPRIRRFGSLPALSFAPVHHNATSLAIKHAIDIVGAGLGIVLTAPVLAAAAIAIKLTSPGPVIFTQERCTMNGRRFVMPKLRTMRVDAEAQRQDLDDHNEMDGPVFKMRDDPRVTPVGRFLRRYSLDELPQLWSVVKGDMSLVGPRPPLPDEVAAYRTFERRRLSMRPGLTCLWQVSGRNTIGFDDWVRLDLEYIDTWSLRSDLQILARTIPVVLSGAGAS